MPIQAALCAAVNDERRVHVGAEKDKMMDTLEREVADLSGTPLENTSQAKSASFVASTAATIGFAWSFWAATGQRKNEAEQDQRCEQIVWNLFQKIRKLPRRLRPAFYFFFLKKTEMVLASAALSRSRRARGILAYAIAVALDVPSPTQAGKARSIPEILLRC